LVVGFKTNLEIRMAMPEKAIAAMMSTISEEAPICKMISTNITTMH
jgi:hypothetical protein